MTVFLSHKKLKFIIGFLSSILTTMVSIDHFKKLALSFANAEEQPHFEKTSFRVNKKIFATLDIKVNKAVVKLSAIEQSVFGAHDRTIVYPLNGAWGKQGWTIVELNKVRKNVLKDVLETSYKNVASKIPLKKGTKKTCAKGHMFYKSSECPVCPICEKENKPSEGFLSLVSAPAKRALEGAGIISLKLLSKKTVKEILTLHGMGPGSIPVLEKALKTGGLSFSENKKIASAISKNTIVKVKKVNINFESTLVDEYLQKLKSEHAEILQALRSFILKCDKYIAEHIKWNVPSFYYTGEMKSFDPKDYKRDLIVTNFRQKDHVLLILPSGSKLSNKSEFLEGDYKDGRRLIKIYNMEDFKTKRKKLEQSIKEWITLIDK